MRSLCKSMVMLYGYRIIKTSVVHSAATVHYARKYKIFVYILLYSNIHSCCMTRSWMYRSARFSYTSYVHCATTWLLYGSRISKHRPYRARSSNTFQSCNTVAWRWSCHKIFTVVQDYRIRVIMQQHGCRTVLLPQKYIQRRARFSYTLHSCNMVTGLTAIIVFYNYIRSDTINVFYNYVRLETVT